MRRLLRYMLFTALVCLPATASGKFAKTRVAGEVTVLNATGRPVSDADVVVFETIYDVSAGEAGSKVLSEELSDNHGRATFDVMVEQARNTYVAARKKGLALGFVQPGRHGGPLDRQELTILLDNCAVLAGMVADDQGRPVAGARLCGVFAVEAVNAPPEWLTVTTDGEGRFRFGNIPPDASADFLVTAPEMASVYTFLETGAQPGRRYAAGRTDIRIVLPRQAKIKGTVVDQSRKPVARLRLLARRINTNYYCTCRTVSRKDGSFLFENVAAGTYAVQVIAPYEGKAEWTAKDVKVDVKSGQTVDNVTVSVDKLVSFDVLVRDAATGRPISNALVTMHQDAQHAKNWGWSFYKQFETGRDGIARVQAPLGECQSSVIHPDYDRVQGGFAVGPRLRSRQVAHLTRIPQFSGTVVDEAGRGVGEMTISSLFSGEQYVSTDSAGRFAMKVGGMAGQPLYIVMARCERRNLAGFATTERPGARLTITVRPGLIVTGRITDADGNPVPAARVDITAFRRVGKDRFSEETITDARGRFEIRAIGQPGKDFSYSLRIQPLGHAPLEVQDISVASAKNGRVDLGSFIVRPLDMSISGIVVDAQDKAVPEEIVHLSDVRGGPGQPEKHLITGPDGRFVFDRIAKGPVRVTAGFGPPAGEESGTVYAQAGDRDVRIIIGQERQHAPSASLLGKPLGSLGEFGLEQPVAAGRGKQILLCFWDFTQRPSRHIVQELARQAGRLGQKDLIVILVAASKADEKAMSQWCKEQGVPFPLGRIEDDIEKIRRAWGVRSLPWLILTDREHIVTAEGFALHELNEKIREAENAKS